MPKMYFHVDDIMDDVTGWPQSRPSIFLYKWNKGIFHDNQTTNIDIIIELPVYRYHGIMTIFALIHIYEAIDDVTRS